MATIVKGQIHLLNVLHHYSLDLCDLSLHFCKFVDLLRVLVTIPHVLFKFRPTRKHFQLDLKVTQNIYKKTTETNETCYEVIKYPYSRLRPLALALLAFPPLYFFENSSLTLSINPIGSCRPANSVATTQYAVDQRHCHMKNVHNSPQICYSGE